MCEQSPQEEIEPLPSLVGTIVDLIHQLTADTRPHPRLRMTTIFDAKNNQFTVSQYSEPLDNPGKRHVASIRRVGVTEGHDENAPDTREYLVFREGMTQSLVEVFYDESSEYIESRQCTEAEVLGLLDELTAAREFEDQQRIGMEKRMTRAAWRGMGF